MKKVASWVFSIGLIIAGCYLMYAGIIKPRLDKKPINYTKELIFPGEVFVAGKYTEVDGVEILYDGESFLLKNNRADLVRVSCMIVGVKADGTYDVIQYPSFVGVDKTQYNKDKSENGWAIEKYTNLVRPNETLSADLTVYDFNTSNDVDGDGYLDIVFRISPQTDEKTISVSTYDVISEIYKLTDK